MFEALLFTIMGSGHRVRCALEESNSGDIRLNKLCRLIDESAKSIHDLSRVELNDHSLPQFNMPLELGIVIGAQQFGGKHRRDKKLLILIRERHRMPVYISDLGGNDPDHHDDDPEKIVAAVRNFIRFGKDGAPLPGAKFMINEFQNFKSEIFNIAKRRRIARDEVSSLRGYSDFVLFISEYLTANPVS